MRTRREIAAGGLLALALSPLTARADARSAVGPDELPDEIGIGEPTAAETVIAYAAFGCTHCATWHVTVFPAFRAKFIDTGRVRFVVREMATVDMYVSYSGPILARAFGAERYFDIMGQIFKAVHDAGADLDGPELMRAIALDLGMDESTYVNVVENQGALRVADARMLRNRLLFDPPGAPTFLIRGRPFVGQQSMAQLDAALRAPR